MTHTRTKIVCTLGPSSEAQAAIEKMVLAGMDVARINFSHGTHESNGRMIARVRAVAKKFDAPIAVLQDIQGPKIRIGLLPDAGVVLKEKSIVRFAAGASRYDAAAGIPIDVPDLASHLREGERMLIADGLLEVCITHIQGSSIDAEVVVGGTITSHKGLNFPDSILPLRALTEKDKDDVRFGVAIGADYIALSFVKDAQDVLDLRFLIEGYRKTLRKKDEPPIRIIAKIERHEALKNIKEIVEAADGIMVARGDLGLEMPAEDVPIIQKKLIDMALNSEKPVIVATQMLDSMQTRPRPTRAEVSDVANAVIDHTDAVMLSNETASGRYPIESVQTMSRIIAETEASVYDDMVNRMPGTKKQKADEILSEVARVIGETVRAKLILVASLTGETGRLMSRFRPERPIYTATQTERVRNQLNLSWGVIPFILKPCKTIEELVARSVVVLKKRKAIKKDDTIIVVAGEPVGEAGHVNVLEVREVE